MRRGRRRCGRGGGGTGEGEEDAAELRRASPALGVRVVVVLGFMMMGSRDGDRGSARGSPGPSHTKCNSLCTHGCAR